MDKRKTILVFIAGALAAVLVVLLVPRIFGPGGSSTRREVALPEETAPAVDFSQPIADLKKMLAANPNDVETLVQLGNLNYDAYQARGATTSCLDSIRYYERALALAPGNPNVLTDLGYMYRCAGKLMDAETRFKMAMKAGPTHPQSRMNLGILYYYDLKDAKMARPVFEEYLRLDPKSDNAAAVRKLLSEIDAQTAGGSAIP